jgi:hypothetical protein
VEPIDTAQAREHIEMVERILAESSQRLCFGGEFFLVWGVYSALATIVSGLVSMNRLPVSALWFLGAALVVAIAFSVVRGVRLATNAGRKSIVQREFFNVLWLTICLAFVANFTMFNLFSGWGSAAIWSFAEAIVLLFIGMHGNRRAQLGGIVMLASLIAANFVRAGSASAIEPGYVLAAGMLLGYAGFGMAELLARE